MDWWDSVISASQVPWGLKSSYELGRARLRQKWLNKIVLEIEVITHFPSSGTRNGWTGFPSRFLRIRIWNLDTLCRITKHFFWREYVFDTFSWASPILVELGIFVLRRNDGTNKKNKNVLSSKKVVNCQNFRFWFATTGLEIDIFVSGLTPCLNPFRTAVPFWGQTTGNLSGLSPKTGLQF